MTVALIDNYDSFSHNLARYIRECGQSVEVIRNDAMTLAEIEAMDPSHVVISPGPCTPERAGISLEAVRFFAAGGRCSASASAINVLPRPWAGASCAPPR